MILVANKVDLDHQRKVKLEEGADLAAEMGVSKYFFTILIARSSLSYL